MATHPSKNQMDYGHIAQEQHFLRSGYRWTSFPSLNDIGTQQSTPTQAMIADNEWIMDFFYTYPNIRLCFLPEICNCKLAQMQHTWSCLQQRDAFRAASFSPQIPTPSTTTTLHTMYPSWLSATP
eukprot:1335421-Ditylum_brightwellii.AAC.1